MAIDLSLQIASDEKTLPHPAQFREWVTVALAGRVDTGELTIRVVDEEESAALNKQYRQKEGPTNVLSFPYNPIPGLASRLLGDIVICAPIVTKEAALHKSDLLAQWAHMVIHGILHLLGYDHETDEEALEMEQLETNLLMQLGFPPPYDGEVILP